MDFTRKNFSSGAPLETRVGYSRMVRVGPFLKIGGTTSVLPDGSVYGEDAYTQTKYILEKFLHLLAEAGAGAKDVIAVKVYAVDMKLGGEIARAYSEFFKDVKPLFTVVGTTALNRPAQLVEIEAEAVMI
jgi:enamine deaminase RidA (YjgF/YER057c/UK114 family)